MNMKEQNKTIVFCFDGTGNEPSDADNFKQDGSISNVLKLHLLMGGWLKPGNPELTTPNGNQQLPFYFSGIGTRDEWNNPLLGTLNQLRKAVNLAVAPSWGDAEEIVEEAVAAFKQVDYTEEDKIVVFGFSRGAALARRFASTIIKKEGLHIDFLGVFDTVVAIGGVHLQGKKISSDVVFENGTLHENIRKAVHIVSLDENRIQFTPKLINVDMKKPDRILEVWFPGIHSDVGGGYWYDGLSDLTLNFMINECKKQLDDDISFTDGTNQQMINSLLSSHGRDLLISADDVMIHENYKGMMHINSEMYNKLGQSDCRKVYVAKDDKPDETAYPIIHFSVKRRFENVVGYRPSGLRDLKFKLLCKDNNTVNVHGISGLRSLQI